ncbi:DNA polymerase IV [Aeromicrobium chenweiae]|uniref:DNA polymerase IV n=1 Tax=Aeromicrobium chenweiae TaxID=2079793 RepID=A0A2S0WRW8_9ACTN|nr:DNA polymerase IV [Aeromicrobium chenweiae]AWB94095.1 DNA polymerase IV [Aeromicrobium chenweiae]TGN32901.1 DNA polymerase IV [Aeromicrobium chenweiae]
MRSTASIMHLDLDAFFASVEQRDKPSLRGRPVIVGGIGPRGVVATASYEARVHGVRSAMRTAEARARCPHAAFLGGRFDAYREASRLVMDRLREESELIEPLSLDEAFVDLAAGEHFDPDRVEQVVDTIRTDITEITGGLTASVGVASSKLMAKIASEINKPNGVFVVEPGTESDVLGPMQVNAIPGVGPATAERLRRVGILTVEDLRTPGEDELVRLLGQASGRSLHRLARADDDRPVVASREAKSVSVEDTFEQDISDRLQLETIIERMARGVSARLRKNGLSGRTVTLKMRHHDFETHTRSSTLAHPTDNARVLATTARGLLAGEDISNGLRLLGVGVSGLADWVQDDLFSEDDPEPEADEESGAEEPSRPTRWYPGMDVHHTAHGDGWVWGAGLGRVTVRFETRWTPPGPVRTFRADDPALGAGHSGTFQA